jgi:hypothetical protein
MPVLNFELTNATATLEHLNTRTEGADDIPAATLKISCAQSADVLGFFDIRVGDLFDVDGPKDLAGGMAVRHPHWDYPLALDHEMSGATVTIEYGLGKMELRDCEIKDFQITPMAGGTVVIGSKVNCKPDAFKQLPHLYLQQKKGVTITLKPAPLPEMKEASAPGRKADKGASVTKDGEPITPLMH